MLVDIRWIPLLVTNVIVILMTQYLNGLLSPLLVYMYIGAALIISPALLLDYKGGVAVVILTSFFLDAGTTGIFGLATPMLLLGFVLIYITRSNVRQNSMSQNIILALCANAVFFLVMALTLPGESIPLDRVYWQHMAIDFMVSEIAILLVVPYLHLSNIAILDALNLNPVREEFIS